MAENPMWKMIEHRKNGKKAGIYSACSANEFVIEAVLERAAQTDTDALIEATANQVNQFGGYTGMLPEDFVRFVHGIAKKVHFPADRVILGGDHLGPLVWQNEPEESALEKAKDLVNAYVKAGFQKIHIDTSMRLGDDNPDEKLPDERIADRAAKLVRVSEAAYDNVLREHATTRTAPAAPVYIIGSEVPIPGGAQENNELVTVTKAYEFQKTYETFRERFLTDGLGAAFDRVIAVVVQPGVEFADASVKEYNREEAAELCNALRAYPGVVFEGHSTDYQTRKALKEMVEDGVAILKVGPALTYALRQALFALNDIEETVLTGRGAEHSMFRATLEQVMLADDSQWRKHYHGSVQEIALKRQYSFSDRCRYYLPEKDVVLSIARLIHNIDNAEIPISVLEQFLPVQYQHLREGRIGLKARELLKDRIKDYIDDYLYAIL